LTGPIDAIETGQRNPLAFDLQNQIALWLLEQEKFFRRNARASALARAFDLGRLRPLTRLFSISRPGGIPTLNTQRSRRGRAPFRSLTSRIRKLYTAELKMMFNLISDGRHNGSGW